MIRKKHITAGLTLGGALLFFACTSTGNKTTNTSDKADRKSTTIATPIFNGDSAYHYVDAQVAFGPRVPNTEKHAACANYLASQLKRFGAHVIVQEAPVIAFDGTTLNAKNIIGQFNPEQKKRILLFAHWDTRPFADHDPDPAKRNTPILGANDGASGVGVLLEIARQLGKTDHHLGIDIIFFDAEDYGTPDHKNMPYKEDTWCLGSQYWAKNPHTPNYRAKYGILLDMVGARDALFYKERYSMQYAPNIVEKVWNTAADIGYLRHFSYDLGGQITDDHVYVATIRNIPCIDIIQHDPMSETSFGTYWHTHDDTMENIDKNTLKAVGQTVLEVIYSEK
ncbi:M28 family peptidase [Marinilabiliaceae bacterium JC017]|nr:M28 family peptidase [Marinilabiliaceae bacterium JC017]